MKTRNDIIKIAISVMMINLLVFVMFEVATLNVNSSESEINDSLNRISNTIDSNENQIERSGIVMEGIDSKTECDASGGVWSDSECLSDISSSGSFDFSWYDIFFSVFKVVTYIWKVIKLIGMIVLMEIIILVRLVPMVSNGMVRALLSLLLLVYQAYVLYYVYAFISNFRGQQSGVT